MKEGWNCPDVSIPWYLLLFFIISFWGKVYLIYLLLSSFRMSTILVTNRSMWVFLVLPLMMMTTDAWSMSTAGQDLLNVVMLKPKGWSFIGNLFRYFFPLLPLLSLHPPPKKINMDKKKFKEKDSWFFFITAGGRLLSVIKLSITNSGLFVF